MLSIIIKDLEPRIIAAPLDATCSEPSSCAIGLVCPTKKATDPAKQDTVTALDKLCVPASRCDTTDSDDDGNEFTYKCVKEAGPLRPDEPCTASVECMVEYRCAAATLVIADEDKQKEKTDQVKRL